MLKFILDFFRFTKVFKSVNQIYESWKVLNKKAKTPPKVMKSSIKKILNNSDKIFLSFVDAVGETVYNVATNKNAIKIFAELSMPIEHEFEMELDATDATTDKRAATDATTDEEEDKEEAEGFVEHLAEDMGPVPQVPGSMKKKKKAKKQKK